MNYKQDWKFSFSAGAVLSISLLFFPAVQISMETFVSRHPNLKELWAIPLYKYGVLFIIYLIPLVFFLRSLHSFFFSFVRPLFNGMKIVSDGDYEYRLPKSNKGFKGRVYNEFNLMIKNIHKKLTLQKYVSRSTREMVDQLKTGEITQKPSRQKVTLLFSDIREFTTYSEDHDPLDVITTINSLFHIQVEIINKYKGDIDKFIGDEIMAIFPAPNQAFLAAKEIQNRMKEYNEDRFTPLYLGIGIHTGYAVIGAIGAENSFDWTAIGDVVNSAKRLCSAAPARCIFVSEKSYEGLRNKRGFSKRKLKVKGRKQLIETYIFDTSQK